MPQRDLSRPIRGRVVVGRHSYRMSCIRAKDSEMELLLRKRLWAVGLRYRKHYKATGCPDIAFPRDRVAVFCDSAFWHGHTFRTLRSRWTREGKTYWLSKIRRNMQRDREVTRILRADGWTVIRFSERQVLMNPDGCVEKVRSVMRRARSRAMIG